VNEGTHQEEMLVMAWLIRASTRVSLQGFRAITGILFLQPYNHSLKKISFPFLMDVHHVQVYSVILAGGIQTLFSLNVL
jgi:hypothetical protein